MLNLAAALASGLIVAAPQAAPPPLEIYAIRTLPDGARYIGSDIFRPGRTPDLRQHTLDAALEITDAAVRHVPTGLTLPRVHGACTLQHLSGLGVGGGFNSFERGGTGYYACEDGAPGFIILSFEADTPRFAEVQPDPARALLASAMPLQRDPAELDCSEEMRGEVRRVTCLAQSEWRGETVTEIGVFAGQDDTFIKLNAACLEAQCEAAGATLDALAAAVGADQLPPDAHGR